MSEIQKRQHVIIGTAGHIDHGKSTLVQVLTGTDPDRWAEEKKRGITIDLGFAHYCWEDRLEISFVDVPGHEGFIHNMLAGAGGIQILLLIVAADDGVMPQTREHLHICDLLGIKLGIVVITRCDLADPALVELVREEIEEMVESTFLEEAPMMEVFALKGKGMEELKQTIASVAKQCKLREEQNFFRMPIDRVFSLKGFGTVITGTALSGRAEKTDPLSIYPEEIPSRIRGFQVHGKSVRTIESPQRAAINLSGIDKEHLSRGNQIATPHSLVNTRSVFVELNRIPDKEALLKHRTPLKFFSHTQEIQANFYHISSGDSLDSKSYFAKIRLKETLSCRFGDRFILRTLSPNETVAGGRIIAPLGRLVRRNRDRMIESLTGLSQEEGELRIVETIFLRGISGVQPQELPPLTGCSQKTISKVLQKLSGQGKIVQINLDRKRFLHEIHCHRVAQFFIKTLKIFHQQNPELPGALGSDFFGKMSRLFQQSEITFLLSWTNKRKLIEKREQYFHLPGFQGGLTPKNRALLDKIVTYLQQCGNQPPGIVNLSEAIEIPQDTVKSLIKKAVADKTLVRIKEDLFFHSQVIEKIQTKLLEHFNDNQQLTIIEFKELINIARKPAVSLLEYFDSLHLTRREENHRILHRKD